MIVCGVLKSFSTFAAMRRESRQDILVKKKRYAYLVDENLRNFQKVQGLHNGSTRIAWTVISIFVLWVFSGPSSTAWHSRPRFFLLWFDSFIINFMYN